MSAKSSYQETFQKGTIPKQLPNGFYNGKVHTLSDIKTPWLGKSVLLKDNSRAEDSIQ
jgi:hypothetical protein